MKRAALLGLFLVLRATTAAAAIVADEANDICDPTADPCVITQTVTIGSEDPNKVSFDLDFGTRAVQIGSGGLLDTGTFNVRVLCGSFFVVGGLNPGVKVRGPNGLGSIDGGFLILDARRRCALDANRPCLDDINCSIGTCSLSVCSGDNSRVCASDGSCNVGGCVAGKCAGDSNRNCVGDGDCVLGSCSVSVCSAGPATQCSTNSDCNFGACSDGLGNIQLASPVRADGGSGGGVPGAVLFRAAGDFIVASTVTADSNTVDSDGGTVDLEAGGVLTVNGRISATGGNQVTGGDIVLVGQDVVLNAPISANGGDFDGGTVEIDAKNDVAANGDVQASSTAGGGFGGELIVEAGRDIVAGSLAAFEVDGHYSTLDNFGGDGGTIDLSAGRDINAKSGARFSSVGAFPDGYGGDLAFAADRDITLAGTVLAKSAPTGSLGAGGSVDVTAVGAVRLPADGVIDVRGAGAGGGFVSVATDGPMTFDGTIDARTSGTGRRGSVSVAVGDLTMNGVLRISGAAPRVISEQVDFEFCRFTMNSGSVIESAGTSTKNVFRAHEHATVALGASITADAATGSNRFVSRDELKPPVINGTVTPAPTSEFDSFLSGCPVCGNSELDGGETCEDGNTENGDGCSSDCQDEACIAQTPGYPSVPLCSDGDGCTKDVCVEGICTHLGTCDDGIDCTVDSCNQAIGQCQHVVSNGLCSDNNPCTDDICSLSQHGCVLVANTDLCDDGVSCTGNDRCSAGSCRGGDTCPDGETCNPDTNQCQITAVVCGDGAVGGTEQCDDGDTQWALGQPCDAGCQLVQCGDPDDSGAVRTNDALFVLRAATGLSTCASCICNVDSNTSGSPVTSGDALRVLRFAVGVGTASLTCPACP